MEIVLILALTTGLFGLVLIKRQQDSVVNRSSYKKSRRASSSADYLKTVIKNTNERLDKEKQEQEYKNKIKKNYL